MSIVFFKKILYFWLFFTTKTRKPLKYKALQDEKIFKIGLFVYTFRRCFGEKAGKRGETRGHGGGKRGCGEERESGGKRRVRVGEWERMRRGWAARRVVRSGRVGEWVWERGHGGAQTRCRDRRPDGPLWNPAPIRGGFVGAGVPDRPTVGAFPLGSSRTPTPTYTPEVVSKLHADIKKSGAPFGAPDGGILENH